MRNFIFRRLRTTLGQSATRPIEVCPAHRKAAKCWRPNLSRQGSTPLSPYKPLHHPLGHAFTNAIFYLVYDRKGFPYPIVAVRGELLRTQGGLSARGGASVRQAGDGCRVSTRRRRRPGIVQPRRRNRPDPCRITLSRSAAGIVRMVHTFLTAKNHYLYPDRAADRLMSERMHDSDYHTWRTYAAQSRRG